MSKDPDRSKRIWDTVLTVGLIVLVFLWFNSCAKEEAKREDARMLKIADQAARDATILALDEIDEYGYISEYQNRGDGIYVKLPPYIIDMAVHIMEGYDTELTPEEYHNHLDEMWSVSNYIYENIPSGY